MTLAYLPAHWHKSDIASQQKVQFDTFHFTGIKGFQHQTFLLTEHNGA